MIIITFKEKGTGVAVILALKLAPITSDSGVTVEAGSTGGIGDLAAAGVKFWGF